MNVSFINVRDAESVENLMQDGRLQDHVENFIKTGERYLPEGRTVVLDALPDVGDVIPLRFVREGEKAEMHVYFVLGRAFGTPEVGDYTLAHNAVRTVMVFVHSEEDALNADWMLRE